MTAAGDSPATGAVARRLPPVGQLVVASLALTVVGGIVMASYVPRRPPLGLPVALLVASGALTAVAGAMLSRLFRPGAFAWRTFFLVARWAFLAYMISAGIIELAFVHNHTRGAPLVVVSLMLVVFAVDVPLVIAYTVASHAVPEALSH